VSASCNTLQQHASRCNTLQHTASRCNTLQHTATHCNTLQHTATKRITLQQHTAPRWKTTQQHTATLCNTLQHSFYLQLRLQHFICFLCERAPADEFFFFPPRKGQLNTCFLYQIFYNLFPITDLIASWPLTCGRQ